MLSKIIKKYKLKKRILELIVALVILSISFFIDYFNSEKEIKIIFNENEQVYSLPEEKNAVYNFIDKAEKSIDITIYMLSDNTVKNKLIEKNKNGINVRIILEKTPFGGGSINYKTFNEFIKEKINIKYSNPEFSLTHAKYIIIDKKEAFIMTANLTYSGLHNDRDFIIYENSESIINDLNLLFENDFNYKKYIPKNSSLIISPINSRNKLELLINNATKDIKIYAENIGDKNIENLLTKKLQENVSVKIIVPDSKLIESNKEYLNRLEKAGAKISNLKKPYQHAKILIIDESIMYLGSINFSRQSMEENREVGIITINKNSISKVVDIFNKDF